MTIAFVLALTASACTIHRHYHTAPQQPEATASYDEDLAGAPGADSTDQPIPPAYAKPTPYPRQYQDDDQNDYRDDYRDDYRPQQPIYDGYSNYEHRCDCDARDRRAPRPVIRRPPPRYPSHPGPVVPDNPVEWLE